MNDWYSFRRRAENVPLAHGSADMKKPVTVFHAIEELIKPNDARANVPVWRPLGHEVNRPYMEKSRAAALAMFKKIPPGRKVRLVRVEVHVVAEKE
jgi:hypothetical protein